MPFCASFHQDSFAMADEPRLRLRSYTLAIFFLLSFACTVWGQVDTGAIVGTVYDVQHHVIADAQITLQRTSQSSVRSTSSGKSGDFSFSPLAIGTYSLIVESKGFARSVTTDIPITAQSTFKANTVLQIDTVAQSIKVTSQGSQLQTQSSSVQQLVDERHIVDLPLNGRNVTLLAQTAPGVTISQQDTVLSAASGSFSANGARRGQNNYLLDGIDNNAAIGDYANQSQYVLMPPPDALQEFVVQTSDYSAEFGKAAGAVLNASTKSGSDKVHLSVWEFFRNDALEARDYFANASAKPAYLQN